MKSCTKCKISKELSDFSTSPSTKDGRHSWCKPCKRAWQEQRMLTNPRAQATYVRSLGLAAKRRKENPEKWHAQWWCQYLKRTYGITPQQHAELLVKQKGVCAICQKENRKLYVDHEHESSPCRVRGLLCIDCNTAMGKFSDSVAMLERVITYLKGEL